MGEFGDYYMDLAMQQDWEDFALAEANSKRAEELIEQYKMGIAEWETRKDGCIMVTDMTNDHVKNCITFLKLKKKKEKTSILECWLKIFKAECKKRKI